MWGHASRCGMFPTSVIGRLPDAVGKASGGGRATLKAPWARGRNADLPTREQVVDLPRA